MIIFLTELQKDHLKLLHEHSVQVLIDFCKLAVEYINKGANSNKYGIAAEKLKVPLATIRNLVQALVYLILEGSKHNLSESDFRSSLALAGFSNDQQDVMSKLYNTKKKELYEALQLLQRNDPKYIDFAWRFEVQIASRNSNEGIKPVVTMDFVTMRPKSFALHEKETIINRKQKATNYIVDATVQEAKAAIQCQNNVNHTLLQCDIPNLIHLTNKLDQALKESKSQHVRKVQRSL
ncbi:COMM domain-containing protein 2-like [Bombyx mandarina]|uniref:COMM domain-containing protein n=2 Tax=Bombyx TaxID=7090 RepID=A0A8R1WI40_BOMMO|nr:COMM domain-containing protein 2 [Bombyx mori]XP_028037092.1 COMM domain-containing protein 2-like [Bombyx mandarina]